jgi:hypothetical protein
MDGDEEQIYAAVAAMDVYVQVWAGGGELGAVAVNGRAVAKDPITGVGEMKLALGADLKDTTVGVVAAFLRTNPLTDAAFLTVVFLQRRQATDRPDFNKQKFGPLAAPFNGQTTATLQTSVSVI